MSSSKTSFATKRRYGERGQALVMVPALLTMLLAASALVVDMGNLYFSYSELLRATQAAAKAAGQAMANPNATSVTSVADQYSGQTSSDYNYNANLNVTGVNVKFDCVNPASYAGFNLPPCAASTNSSYPGCTVNATYNPNGGCNVVQVQETATVQTFFAKVFGVTSLNISATAVSSAGGSGVPYHIVVVLDSTASMGQGTDTNCSAGVSGSFSPEQCAQLGVQSLLSVLATGTGSNPIDEVALMTFPGLTPSSTKTLTDTTAGPTASDDSKCPASNPSITSYNNNPEYLIIGFPGAGGPLTAGDYISSTGGLNPKSALVDAVGASQITNSGSCSGIQTPGGEGTFYAGAIVAAQDYLAANPATGVQNVIIFLSDGGAGNGDTSGSVKQNVSSSQIAGMNGNLFSNDEQCTQAVNAANWAKGQSTQIFAVSYGSGSNGCSSGESYTPCTTMQGIASTPTLQYFFSVEEKQQTGKGTTTSVVCSTANQNVTAMNSVFTYIGGRLTGARLIPNADF